jgi:hypothetical protein
MAGANSGVYFHTAWLDKGWPAQCAVDTPAADHCFGIRERVGLFWRDMYQPGHVAPRGANVKPGAVP